MYPFVLRERSANPPGHGHVHECRSPEPLWDVVTIINVKYAYNYNYNYTNDSNNNINDKRAVVRRRHVVAAAAAEVEVAGDGERVDLS